MSSADCGFIDKEGVSAQNLLIRFGPTLAVRIGFDPSYPANGAFEPKLPEKVWLALADTGAGESCIDSALAAELELPIVDRRSVSGVHGKGRG